MPLLVPVPKKISFGLSITEDWYDFVCICSFLSFDREFTGNAAIAKTVKTVQCELTVASMQWPTMKHYRQLHPHFLLLQSTIPNTLIGLMEVDLLLNQ